MKKFNPKKMTRKMFENSWAAKNLKCIYTGKKGKTTVNHLEPIRMEPVFNFMKSKRNSMSKDTNSMKLLDCPHCGASSDSLDKRNGKGVYAYQNAPSSDIQPWIHVVCLECGSSSPSVEKWNSRVKA